MAVTESSGTNDLTPMHVATPGGRIIGATLALGAIALLGTAAWLTPNTEGIGTHTQLGMHECSWHRTRGFVCPTCGMTTSFALAADGRLLAAFDTQPAGAAFAVLTGVAFWIGLYVAVTGAPLLGWLGHAVRPRWAIAGVAAIVLLAWGYKALTVG